MSGVTADGFEVKTLQDIKDDLEAALRGEFGESIDLSPQSNFGQLVGVFAERFADLWAAGEDVYAAATPDSATGVSLDNVCAITGTVREEATNSTVTITATGTATTVLSSGRIASVSGTGTRFLTTEAATIAAATAWVNTTAYVVGDIRKNGGTVRIYRCITSGTSAGSGGPTTTAADITDGTVHWEYLGDGNGFVHVAAESEDTGPKVAVAGTLTVIETPVSGWSGVFNILDATEGTDEEVDATLRIRREDELRASGNAAIEAIRSNVLEVDGVTAVTVFENVTDATDVDSVPPHAVDVLVQGGDDAEVAAAVFASVAAGIATYGTTTETVTDSQGIDHTIKFSRPAELLLYVRIDLTYDADLYPADGDAQVKAAVVAFGDAQRTGKNAVAASVGAQAFSIAGVLDTPIVYIGLSNPAIAATTIAATLRQLVVFDTSRVTVNSSAATP